MTKELSMLPDLCVIQSHDLVIVTGTPAQTFHASQRGFTSVDQQTAALADMLGLAVVPDWDGDPRTLRTGTLVFRDWMKPTSFAAAGRSVDAYIMSTAMARAYVTEIGKDRDQVNNARMLSAVVEDLAAGRAKLVSVKSKTRAGFRGDPTQRAVTLTIESTVKPTRKSPDYGIDADEDDD